MRVLLTATAYGRFWGRLSRPGVEALVMAGDGVVTTEGGVTVGLREADPDIGWGTSDLFAAGSPRRAFLGCLLHAASLRWFQSPAAGYDDPFFADLARRGVRVTNAHVNGVPIAEYVLRAVLEHFQSAASWRRAEAARQWELHDFQEVQGSTWLVVGLGSIGGGVARRARAFGATVIGCRRRPGPDDPVDRSVTLEEVPGVIGEADVVVLAMPATAQTNGLMDATLLGAMKPGALLVNVARGTLVDEEALLGALDLGRPGAAVLDVFSTEPLAPDHPFWSHPAVTVTPHNAAGGVGRYSRQADLFAENLERFLSGRPLLNDVSAETLAVAG